MAALELRGELKRGDGDVRQFIVKVEENLQSVLSGLRTLSADVSEVLTELVSQDKEAVRNGRTGAPADDEEEDVSDEEEKMH